MAKEFNISLRKNPTEFDIWIAPFAVRDPDIIIDNVVYMGNDILQTTASKSISSMGNSLSVGVGLEGLTTSLTLGEISSGIITTSDISEIRATTNMFTEVNSSVVVGGDISEVIYTLPYEIVSGLKFSGSQFTNTGVTPTPSTKVRVKCKPAVQSTMFAFGSRQAFQNQMFCIAANFAGNEGWLYQIGANSYNTKPFFPSVQALDEVDIYMAKTGSTLNGASINQTFVDVTTSHELYIGALNQAGTAEARMFNGDIMLVQLWDGDILIRDYIPVKLRATGEYGWWELLSNTFHGNEGTGTYSLAV